MDSMLVVCMLIIGAVGSEEVQQRWTHNLQFCRCSLRRAPPFSTERIPLNPAFIGVAVLLVQVPNLRPISTFFLVVTTFAGSLSSAPGDTTDDWITIDNPDEIRELISGRALDGEYWKFYFRADGVMGYSKNNFPSVRGWSITEDGKLCYSVYSMPDRIIDCDRIQRTQSSPATYRFKSETREFPIRFSAPAQDLIDAVAQRAGPE